jgi:hypothetical protein
VATGCLDLRASPDDGRFAEMGQHIASASASRSFDTLYVSNLPWMLAQREGFFGEDNTRFTAGRREAVIAQVRANLAAIAPHFRHVVAAGQLAENSRADDLQWETRLLTAEALLDPRYWSVLEPVGGPFRSLR